MDSTKIIELFIDDDYEEAGIEAISLVSKPAHEENWLAFNSQLEVETEELNPYHIVEDNFCDNNPLFLEIGESYSALINDGWEIVKVQKITPTEVYRMQEQKFSNPNEESQLDTDQIRVRYKYIGPVDDDNRRFCAQMMAADRVYRIEDIEQLSNPEFGNYNIFLYRGSYNCRHAWVRLVYKKQGKIANDAGRTGGLITEDVVIGADTRNKGTIAVGETGLYAPRDIANPRKATAEQIAKDRNPRDGSQFAPKGDFFAEIGEKGGIKESKKAPKSDTPNPNPKGEGTAKGKAESTRGAVVTEKVEASLKQKADDFNERYKEKLGYGVNVGMLKSVYQRGVGAYNTSHSPTVKSAEQWAQARVNAFLYLVRHGRPENAKYTTDYDLLPSDHPKKQNMSEDEFAETINDYPEGVKAAAQRALNWAEKNGWGSCGTPVGKTRANQLAKGENISIETIKRMFSFLSRHKGQGADKGKYGEGCGKLMYDAWGGDAGLTWSERKLRQIEKQKMTFAFDEEKKIIIGAAMVPNRMIHRYDSFGNLYYVFFSKESIKKLAQKFLKEGRTDDTSIEHNGIKLGKDKVFITESWISEDAIHDKSVKYGFNLPIGSWYVAMKVNDDSVWKMIKEKALNGFSVEGLFAEKSIFSKEDKQINQIKQILKSINDE